jgi:hypothetical protein
MRASGLLPKGLMSAVRMLAQNPHRNNGIMVMVGCNTFMRVFYDTFMKLFPQRGVKQVMYMAANDEDAQAIFARYGDSSTDAVGQSAHH